MKNDLKSVNLKLANIRHLDISFPSIRLGGFASKSGFFHFFLFRESSFDSLIKFQNVFFSERVAERPLRDFMNNFFKFLKRLASDPLRWRIGRDKLGILLFNFCELILKRVKRSIGN